MLHVPATVVLAAFWILDPLYTALGTVLAWFYDVIPSYGVAIILLTLAVRLLTFPLTAKQARSQQQLQKLQPELKRLQAKYKGDKQKLNEEMMKFYKEHHVNPFGGCLPLFIQFPVLIVLYRLILGLTRTFIIGFTIAGAAVAVGGTAPAGPLAGAIVQSGPNGHVSDGTLKNGVITKGTLDDAQAVVDGKVVGTVTSAKIVDGKVPTAQVMNGKVVVGTLTDLAVTGGEVAGAPKNVPESSSLFRALKASGGKMESWGMDLAKRASDTSGSEEIPFAILVLLVGATGFYQQRQLTARLPKESANSQMAVMGKIFPLIFVVISWTIPAGVVVYFLVSNIWQIGQQAFMFRNQPKPEPGPAASGKAKKGPTPPAGKGKGKPVTTKGARATTKGAKGAKALGGSSGGPAKRGKPQANANQANGNKTNGNKPNANKRRQDHGAPRPKSKPSRSGQAPRADQTPRSDGHADQTPRPDGHSSQTPRSDGHSGPGKPVAEVKNDLPSKSDGAGGTGPEVPQPTAPGQHSGRADNAVEDLPDEATSSPSPLSPAAPSTQTAEPQGSNGSTPLALPLPPAAGDLNKDGE